jgi:hypothetical protein
VKVVSRIGVNGRHAAQHVMKVKNEELENVDLNLLILNAKKKITKKNFVTIDLVQVRTDKCGG